MEVRRVRVPGYVPLGVVIGRGGATLRALCERHGLQQARVLQDDAVVQLRGSRRHQLAAAEEELEQLFAQQLADQRRRVRVAKNGRAHTWRFAPTRRTSGRADIEINLVEFPFELLRARPCARSLAKPGEADLLVDMDDYWCDAEYAVPRGDDAGLRVLAVVGGATLYAASSAVDLEREYEWHELARLHDPVDVRSRWSDVCAIESSPALWLLLNELFAAAEPQPQTRLKMAFTDADGRGCRLTYVREGDAWVLRKSGEVGATSALHDLSLSNGVSLRVLATPKLQPLRREWQGVAQQVLRFDGVASADDAPDGRVVGPGISALLPGLVVRATPVVIDEKWVVRSQNVLGLRFALSRHFGNKWIVRATLPESERPANTREHFARLRLRLLHLMSIYEDKASALPSAGAAAAAAARK